MNERIKELAIEAGYQLDGFGFGHWDMLECQKFAQLIVEECASYMVKNYPNTRYQVNYMRKHMGDPNWNKPL